VPFAPLEYKAAQAAIFFVALPTAEMFKVENPSRPKTRNAYANDYGYNA